MIGGHSAYGEVIGYPPKKIRGHPPLLSRSSGHGYSKMIQKHHPPSNRETEFILTNSMYDEHLQQSKFSLFYSD